MEHRAFGTWVLRTTLGLIFLMQGFGKVFSIGIENLYKGGFAPFEETFLPVWLLWATVYFTSYMELIGGLMLVLGIGRKWALYGLGWVLVIVSFGHGLQAPIWDLSHLFPRLVLLVALLMLPNEWDRWCLDRLIWRRY